jgi:maltose alpha-D-glucosyltransferase / alpha-amylase
VTAGSPAGRAPAPTTGQIAITALPPRRQPAVPASAVAGSGSRPGLSDDPDWYRTAVFYEVMIRSFSDSTGVGSGDLRGLIARLD